ncbi:hypothetical protein AC579_2456 [Pseudocercospora musae]|uniref:Uncharacterized protein n=1 Tax=Pseudocercospora musae TaxID=113226 RepID=A0A139IHJ0_9PEZI|nr:hypothetical protein AC579_2456 [Pseudocercospora musae]
MSQRNIQNKHQSIDCGRLHSTRTWSDLSSSPSTLEPFARHTQHANQAGLWSDAFTKTLSPTVTTITTYNYTIARYNVTYGTAEVYTTEDGFPYAHGNRSATSKSSESLNVTGTSPGW